MSAHVQMLLDICKDRSQVEAVTCLSLIGVFTRQGSWRLAELAFLAFFRHTGRFGALEEVAAAGGDAARAAQGEADALAQAERAMSDVLNLRGTCPPTGAAAVLWLADDRVTSFSGSESCGAHCSGARGPWWWSLRDVRGGHAGAEDTPASAPVVALAGAPIAAPMRSYSAPVLRPVLLAGEVHTSPLCPF